VCALVVAVLLYQSTMTSRLPPYTGNLGTQVEVENAGSLAETLTSRRDSGGEEDRQGERPPHPSARVHPDHAAVLRGLHVTLALLPFRFNSCFLNVQFQTSVR
jgi:hypothetical protein